VAWNPELMRRASLEDAAVRGSGAGAAVTAAAARGSAAGGAATSGATPSGAAARGAAARGAATSRAAESGAVASGAAASGAAASECVRAAAFEAERRRKQNKRMYDVVKVSVGTLASRPDLANVGSLLRLDSRRHVRVPTRTPIQAEFDCGTRVRQQLRAVDDYLGAPWYDSALYHPGSERSKLCIGELRAIVRGPKGDAVILAAMENVPAKPLCPFFARGCVRLKWRIADNASEITLRLVPVEHVGRLALVVPEIADLSARRGVDADIPTMDSPLQERLDMRFFLSVFFPWDSK